MKKTTWNLIESQFKRFPSFCAKGVSETEFDKAFGDYQFPLDYREFVTRYGAGIIGTYPIYGLGLSEAMGTVGRKQTAPDISIVFRERKWPGVDQWLIFSIDQSGNPIGFSTDMSVWISDLGTGQIEKLSDTFEEFLLKWGFRVIE